MKTHAQQYLKTMVETSSPVENIIVLYEKCLLHLDAARTGLTAGDLPAWSGALHRAMDILCYLEASLDASQPEQAETLQGGYRMIMARLGLVSGNGSLADLEVAQRWIEGMLSAWREAGHSGHGAVTPSEKQGGE